MKILIVDDDQVNRSFLCKSLSAYGQCINEDDGKKAIGSFVKALYDQEPFDLVLLDIMMPNIDGQEALRILRKIEEQWKVKPGKEAKVIMVTALHSPMEVTRAFFQGEATDYVVKPVIIEELKNKIDALFKK